MHSITLTGELADKLGSIYMHKLVDQIATELHESVLLNVRKNSKHHAGLIIQGDPPASKPVRLIKLGPDQWMIQARHGKAHDGYPYNAAGGTVTFASQDAAKEWLKSEPAGRWHIVLN